MGTDTTPDPWKEAQRLPNGQRVEVRSSDGTTWIGRVVPSDGFHGERVLVLKLESGYNVGIRLDRTAILTPLPPDTENSEVPPVEDPGPSPSGPIVALLTTGGTIASRVDYTTGGVRPVQSTSEILSFYPELTQKGPIRVVPVMDCLSENIVPSDWATIAQEVVHAFEDEARGVVVAHGTDTLGYTAAALSFLLVDLPGPVVLVGAQRSPDRPSSDGPSNLTAAVAVAREGNFGEVVVLMHAGLSDHRFAIHRGTRVRKMHSTRRDSFQSRNGPVLGLWADGSLTLTGAVRPRSAGPPKVTGPLDTTGGALLWMYPGLSPERAAHACEGMRGIVLAGTGLGHTPESHLPWIRAAVDRGTVVVMTTQCLEGRVDPYVYATGRELLRIGVLYLEDMLPETAYAKLLWALGQSHDPEEIRRLMTTNRAGEISLRREPSSPP